MTSRKQETALPPPTQPGGPAQDERSNRRYSKLLSAGEQDFDQEIRTLDVRELLGLIACLQREMALEQRHFDRLNTQFQNRKAGLQNSREEDEAVELSAALCRSQIRLAQLCNRNMRCFTQQAARAQQDRSSELLKKGSPPSPTVGMRETIWQNRSDSKRGVNNNNNVSDDEEKDAHERFYENFAIDRSGKEKVDWKRAPSVEDILQTVRSMRQEKDGAEEKVEVAKKQNGVPSSRMVSSSSSGVTSDMKIYNNTNNNKIEVAEIVPIENLVPTATQLLLRMKPVKSNQLEDETEGDTCRGDNLKEVEKNESGGKRNKVRKSIFQQHMFNPKDSEWDQKKFLIEDEPPCAAAEQTQQVLDSDSDDLPLPPPPDDLEDGVDEVDFVGSYKDDAVLADDDRFLEIHTNGSCGQSPPTTFESEPEIEDSVVKTTLTLVENQANSNRPADHHSPPVINDDDETSVPSIIDQFNDEQAHQMRCRGTDVRWNVDDLLEKLYELPQPKPPAVAPAAYINMEGYLEKLPIGKRQGTFWNAWKRRYFKLKDGYLFCFQSSKSDDPIVCLQLMGGRIDMVESQLLVDDGKGHCLMLRCNSRPDTERWRRALLTHTAENYLLTYAQPVVPYPQFYEKVLIVDIGSCSVRAGILCNQPTLPQVYFPTVCAEEKLTGHRVYGKEALSPKIRLDSTITFPLRPSAKITKFTVDMKAVKGILTKVFEDLNVDPAGYEIQLSLPRSFPFKSQTDVLDLLMTEFGVQGVNLMAQTVLALCSYNTTSGVVVDVGERLEVVPIVDGYVIESGVSRIPYGGSRLMDHLCHFLMQRHYGLSSITESFLLRYVLENSCYCALNYKTELQSFLAQPQNYEVNIPVGHFFPRDEAPWESISLDGGRFQAPEGLFRPEAWGLDNAGIHKLAWKAIQECSLDVRKEMSRGIYVSGGVTMLPGFTERLQLEMERLTPPTVQPKVHASPYRAHAAYLGACNWALSAGFHEAKISRDEWIANGSGCLKKWHF